MNENVAVINNKVIINDKIASNTMPEVTELTRHFLNKLYSSYTSKIIVRELDKMNIDILKLTMKELIKYGLRASFTKEKDNKITVYITVPSTIMTREEYTELSWFNKFLYDGGIQEEGYTLT